MERIAAFGKQERLGRGTVLFERGDRRADFFAVVEGFIEIYEDGPDGEPVVMMVHAERQFTGELDLFNDRAILVGGRMGADGLVARLSRAQFQRMLAAEPDLAEVLTRAFILRRTGFVTHDQAGARIVGDPRSRDVLRLRRFLSRNGYPFQLADPGADAAARALIQAEHIEEQQLPVLRSGPGAVLSRPSNLEAAEVLGLSESLDGALVDVAVVGAGPAGLAAGVYSASEGLNTVILEVEAPGGQAATSSRIENYLGFPLGLSGQALAARAQVQAQRFGAQISVAREVARLDVDRRPFHLLLRDGANLAARAVIVATGARYRTLDVDDLAYFEHSAIHYAATAIEAQLCSGEEVVVVGGGNSAGQAAVFLASHARHVHVLVRGEGLAGSMSDYLVERIAARQDLITVHLHSQVVRLGGEPHLQYVTWRHSDTGVETSRPVTNVFLMLGAVPNSDWLPEVVRTDEHGFVCTGTRAGSQESAYDRPRGGLETSVPGVFAVGDVRSGSVKRVASSVGEGSVVVSSLHEALREE